MRQRFAPSHDLLAKARFIPPSDDAWDRKRIDAECAKLGDKAQDREDGHVFWRYFWGATRFDLTAEGISDYLVPGKVPEVWTLKRLSWEDREHISYLTGLDRIDAASKHAFLRSVVTVEGASGEAGERLKRALDKYPRDDDEVIAAVENYAVGVIDDVGTAATRASQDLTTQEKKVSDSQPGLTLQKSGTEG